MRLTADRNPEPPPGSHAWAEWAHGAGDSHPTQGGALGFKAAERTRVGTEGRGGFHSSVQLKEGGLDIKRSQQTPPHSPGTLTRGSLTTEAWGTQSIRGQWMKLRKRGKTCVPSSSSPDTPALCKPVPCHLLYVCEVSLSIRTHLFKQTHGDQRVSPCSCTTTGVLRTQATHPSPTGWPWAASVPAQDPVTAGVWRRPSPCPPLPASGPAVLGCHTSAPRKPSVPPQARSPEHAIRESPQGISRGNTLF